MGGCRCVYRTCQSSTTLSPGLHYFHFPIRDIDRCEQWIKNARKPMLRNIPREKLRNKVICSLHFEERCFTNEKHDRLIHNAVPTLGFDDAPEDYTSFAYQSEDSTADNNIVLIPVSEDNTKFTLPPNVEFSGTSYMIYDDAVIPTSNFPVVQENKPSKISIIVKKHDSDIFEQKIKRPKYTITSFNKLRALNLSIESLKKPKLKENIVEFNNSKSIMSYSVSTCGDDITLELTKKPKENLMETNTLDTKTDAPLLDNDVSLKLKSRNEYTMSVVNNQTTELPDSYSEVAPLTLTDSEFQIEREKEYINMIKNNSKQIVKLKRLINKQNRLHKYMLQRKQLCKFRRKNLNKYKLLENLKNYVKPSLMAILKLEMLPTDDVVLSDSEENFITELYTENPECYNLLLKKYKWNLPNSDNFTEENDN